MTSRALVLAAAVAAASLGIVFHPHPKPGPALRDFEAYYAAGATWRYHGDAYGRDVWRVEKDIPGVVATHDELLPFVGPPFGLPLWEALARLPWGAASFVWGSVVVLAVVTLALCSLWLAGGPIEALDIASVLVFAATFGPLLSGVALGQVAVVSCAAIAASALLLRPRLIFGATAAILVAALQPNLALVLAARIDGRRAWIAVCFAATVVAAGSFLALSGTSGFPHYLEVLRDHAAAERFIAIQTTPAAVARALGASAGLAGSLALGLALAVVALLCAQFISRRYDPNSRLALASAALPLALPFAHEHDLAIAFFPAILALRRAHGAAWVVAACAALLVGVDWLGLAQRPGAVMQPALLALAGALALIALARDRLRPYHFAPLGIAVAVALAGLLAATRPLATWPYGLPAGFHAAGTVPAAVVWHAEQILSGVATLDPASGVLRLCSLAGCALLWLVASVVLAQPAGARQQRETPPQLRVLRSG